MSIWQMINEQLENTLGAWGYFWVMTIACTAAIGIPLTLIGLVCEWFESNK